MFILAAFQPLDWAVLSGYFLVLAVTGWWLSRRRQEGTDDYFLARRSMPMWAVAASIVATALSAATFVGGPQLAYNGNLTYLSVNIGVMIAVVIVAAVFIPVFYRHNVATVYQLLDVRIGPRAKLASSWMFMIGRVFASGSRVFIAAIPASLILFDQPQTHHMLVAIAALVLVGVVYTLVGGIRSVIWSDVIQLVVFVGAALTALAVLSMRIPVGLEEVINVLQNPAPGEPSKLTILESGIDADQPLGIDFGNHYTLITALTGLVLFNIAAYGTDQDMTQRMLTCRSALKGGGSVIGSILINVPVTLLFMLVGLGLYVFYQRPDLMGEAFPAYEPDASREVFVSFILNELPVGVKGLLMAGLFAAGLSSVNSALNAMSSSFVNDFYRPWRAGRSERHYLWMGRAAVVGWGVLLGFFACVCVYWQQASGDQLIDFALGVMAFAYAGLLAVFFTAIFTRRGSETSVIAALVVGFVSVLLLQWQPWAGTEEKWNLSFPWQMLIASGLAFLVCIAGKGERGGRSEENEVGAGVPAETVAKQGTGAD